MTVLERLGAKRPEGVHVKTQFEALLSRMNELKDLSGVIGLASWDQETFLPSRAANARAQQLATLQSIYHQKLTHASLQEALDAVLSDDAATEDQKAMACVLVRERNRALQVPEAWVRQWALAQSQGLAAWHAARKSNDFKVFAPGRGFLSGT